MNYPKWADPSILGYDFKNNQLWNAFLYFNGKPLLMDGEEFWIPVTNVVLTQNLAEKDTMDVCGVKIPIPGGYNFNSSMLQLTFIENSKGEVFDYLVWAAQLCNTKLNQNHLTLQLDEIDNSGNLLSRNYHQVVPYSSATKNYISDGENGVQTIVMNFLKINNITSGFKKG